MLPKSHCEAIQELITVLKGLGEEARVSEPDPTLLLTQSQKGQKILQEKFIILNTDELAPDLASRWQLIQTEIHRELRLLATNIIFLRSSQSSATAQSRLANVLEHIDKILTACELLMQIISNK
ncbi:MAG: heterocyst frequency control protein PatD [Gomphosphaeria aponina SAG 52.96 = DSM 107014]|uniref:Heterocyst frequency control protein PatD n=1 Tax=Gomphosphaeria aponina SAG 52.96 = DSM 107014 TaxID=1521640 RepID=A0A941JST3_9CHRO|nr:heterocyst frequency control protein PatD [Gomphosphaeria aponina SAG 52.96 = DSM 107014]